MTEAELNERFKKFAIGIYNLTREFPRHTVYFKIEDQIIRCSSSSAANYRAACRGKSIVDFINKLGTVEEELDETIFWLEYTIGIDKKWEEQTKPFLKECNELLSIIVASIKTSKKRNIKLKTRY